MKNYTNEYPCINIMTKITELKWSILINRYLLMASLVALLVAMAAEIWTLKENELTCTSETLKPAEWWLCML